MKRIWGSHFSFPFLGARNSAQGAIEDSDSLCGARRWLATVIWSFGLPDADWSEPNFKWMPIAGNINYCAYNNLPKKKIPGSESTYQGRYALSTRGGKKKISFFFQLAQLWSFLAPFGSPQVPNFRFCTRKLALFWFWDYIQLSPIIFRLGDIAIPPKDQKAGQFGPFCLYPWGLTCLA